MKQPLALVSVVAVVALATAATGGGTPAPKLLVSFPGYAYSLGGGGGRIGWIDTAFRLQLRTMTSPTVASIRYTNVAHELPSNYPPSRWQRRLVVNRSGEIWWSTTHTQSAVDLDRVLFAARGATKATTLVKAPHSNGGGGGDFVIGIAGDASGFAYGEVVLAATTPDQVAFHVVGGAVFTVDTHGASTKLPGVPPAYVFARGAGLIVDEPAATDVNESGAPRPSNVIEVRKSSDGSLVKSLSIPGVRAAAVNLQTVVLLVGHTLRRYRVSDGTLLGSTMLPSGAAQEVETDGMVVVARSAQAILVANLATGRLRSLSVARPWHPTGVAIVDGRVVWSESRGQTPSYPSAKTFVTRIRSSMLAPHS